MKITVQKKPPRVLHIEESMFKYFVSVELDKIAEDYREKSGNPVYFDKMINEAYFKIMQRLEPMFQPHTGEEGGIND